MVAMAAARAAGKVLDVLRLRAVRDDCLCLRPPVGTRARYQREYLAVLQVDPCNFTLMSAGEQEAVLEGWRGFLASISPQESGISIHIRIRSYQLAPYLERLRQQGEGQTHPGLAEMAIDHMAFISHLGASSALLRREFFVRIPLSVHVRDGKYKNLSVEEIFDQAKSDLSRKVQEVMMGLSRAGLVAKRLDSEELVQYYQSCIHMRQADEYPIARSQLYALDFPIQSILSRTRQTTCDRWIDQAENKELESPEIISSPRRQWVWQKTNQLARRRARANRQEDLDAPNLMSLPELFAPASIQQSANYTKVHHSVGDEFLRARAIVGYPAFAIAGWFDQLLSIDEPGTDILLFISSLNPTAYVRALSRTISGFRATQLLELRHGRTQDPYISAARSEVEELREKIVAKTELIHSYSLYIMSRANDRQTLKERDSKLLSRLRALELHTIPLQFEHLPAWLSLVDGRDNLRRARKADTSTLVANFPFCSSNISTEPGVLVGLTADGPLILDPASDMLENGHETVFGGSGVGKSYYRKVDLSRALLMGFKAIVIDNETEYQPINAQYHGSSIRLAAGSLSLNPFDLPRLPAHDEQRNVLEEKLDSLLVLFDLLLADKQTGTLTQREKAYLHRLLSETYTVRGITDHPTTHANTPPTMQEFFYRLERDGDPHDMCARLARFVKSFPECSQITALDAQLVVFSLIDLPQEKDSALRAVALYLITDFVWAQCRQDTIPVPRLLLIDEAWTLMRYPDAAAFLASISRRARKYNLALRLATQSAEDFLNSEAGRTILLNCSAKFVMKQDSATIDPVVHAFKLSEEERKFLLGAGKGEGLYFCRASHVPLRVIASEKEHTLAVTTPKERERQLHQATALKPPIPPKQQHPQSQPQKRPRQRDRRRAGGDNQSMPFLLLPAKSEHQTDQAHAPSAKKRRRKRAPRNTSATGGEPDEKTSGYPH